MRRSATTMSGPSFPMLWMGMGMHGFKGSHLVWFLGDILGFIPRLVDRTISMAVTEMIPFKATEAMTCSSAGPTTTHCMETISQLMVCSKAMICWTVVLGMTLSMEAEATIRFSAGATM